MPPKRCPPCPPCPTKAARKKAAPKKRVGETKGKASAAVLKGIGRGDLVKKAAPKKGVVVKKVGQKCPPSHPVGVVKHTSSGVPVKKHCRGKRGGGAAAAAAPAARVGQTKGKASAAVLKGIGRGDLVKKAPAKKRAAPKKKMPKDLIMSFEQGGRVRDAAGKVVKGADATRKKKPLIMSFDQSGRITDAKGKIVKRAAREPAGGRFGERGVISVRKLVGDRGTFKGEPKKIKVKVPKRRAGQKKGALSANIQASLARDREAKARRTNPSAGYA